MSDLPNPEKLKTDSPVLEKRYPVVGESRERGSNLGWIVGGAVLLGLLLLSGWSFFRPTPLSPGGAVATGTGTRGFTPIPTLLYVPMPYTVTVQVPVTVVVTQTKIYSSVRLITATPAPTLFVPTFTPYPLGVVRDGACWIFDLYGVNQVTVDKTPVAPAHGRNRVCGSVVEIK